MLAMQGVILYWLVSVIKKEEKEFSEQKSTRPHDVNAIKKVID